VVSVQTGIVPINIRTADELEQQIQEPVATVPFDFLSKRVESLWQMLKAWHKMGFEAVPERQQRNLPLEGAATGHRVSARFLASPSAEEFVGYFLEMHSNRSSVWQSTRISCRYFNICTHIPKIIKHYAVKWNWSTKPACNNTILCAQLTRNFGGWMHDDCPCNVTAELYSTTGGQQVATSLCAAWSVVGGQRQCGWLEQSAR